MSTRNFRIAVLCLSCWIVLGSVSQAATEPQIRAAITRGIEFLRKAFPNAPDRDKGLIGLTLMKAGLPHDAPEVKAAIDLARKKCAEGNYRHLGEHFYEAGIDASLLVDSGEDCREELKVIAKFVTDNQIPNGAWNYPGDTTDPGDTSTTQYCCLALWAAARGGVEIDPTVWSRVIEWHAQHQAGDGGFAYRPGKMAGDGQGASTMNMTVNSIATIHICMLHLDSRSVPYMERDAPPPDPMAPNKDTTKPTLEVVNLDNTVAPTVQKVPVPASAKPTIARSYGWLSSRFRVSNEPALNRMYYYYSLERMGALADIKRVGSHDWFGECADYVLSVQNQDGSWKQSTAAANTPEIESSFALLFLTRSTGKLLGTVDPQFGNGLLAGGRGLPDDLNGATITAKGAQEKKKPAGPLDELLASLENTGDIDFSEVQEQIVEKVQIGDRNELIKQKDLLVKLATHPDPSVRMTAMWAIGHTDDMRLARLLINGLDDTDLGVMIEAQNGLCWMARKPTGFGFAEDPLDPLGPNPAADAKAQAIKDWNQGVVVAWGKWYLENRPYEDRGDLFEARLKLRLEQIRRETQ